MKRIPNPCFLRWSAAIGLLLPLLVGPTAFAEIDVGDIADIEDLSLELLLENPVTTASKYEQAPSEAPASVSVITAAEIERYGYRTLDEILRSFRGVYISNDRNYKYIGIRGFGIPGDYNSRVLQLVDGHRYNDSVYGSAMIGSAFTIAIDDIERVEFVRGPSSSIYGSNAFLGVINIVTKGAKGVEGITLSATTGMLGPSLGTPNNNRVYDLNAVQLGLRLGHSFDNGIRVYGSVNYFHQEGQPQLYFPEFDGSEEETCVDASRQEVACRGITRSNDADTLISGLSKVSFRDFTLTGHFGAREKEVPTASFETILGDSGSRTLDAHLFFDLAYEKKFKTGLEFISRAAFDRYFYDADYPYDYREEEGELLEDFRVLNRDEAVGSSVATETQVSKKYGRKLGPLSNLRLTGGARFELRFDQEQRNFDIFAEGNDVFLDRQDKEKIAGLYAQMETSLWSDFSLSAGARYDYYLDSFGGTLNPRFGAIYSPRKKTHIKLLYGTAFRAPSAYERFYAFGQEGEGGAQLVNSDLAPETIQTAELVVEQYLSDEIRGTFSGYRYRIHDLIVNDENEDGDLRYENLDEVEGTGLEFELEGMHDRYRARASYSLQWTENVATGFRLVNSPRSLVKANVLAPLLSYGFAGIEARYVGRRLTASGGEADSYVVANLSLSSDRLVEGVLFSLTANNVFDTVFSDPGTSEHVQETIPQDRRTLWLRASYTY